MTWCSAGRKSPATAFSTASGLPCAAMMWYNMCWGVTPAFARAGLGSTTLVLDQNGAKVDEIRYYPYGAERWPLDGTFPTDYRFTGQKYEAGAGGLYQMGARWYDPYINRVRSVRSKPIGIGNRGMSGKEMRTL
jgi:RHS repeat-associated protein